MRDIDELLTRTHDVVALLFFIVFTVIFFLAPVVGYRPEGRKKIAYSLFLLIAYAGMSSLQMLFIYLMVLEDGRGRGGGGIMGVLLNDLGFGRGNGLAYLIIFVTVLKIVFLLSAMVMFVSGLMALQRTQAKIVAGEERVRLPNDGGEP